MNPKQQKKEDRQSDVSVSSNKKRWIMVTGAVFAIAAIVTSLLLFANSSDTDNKQGNKTIKIGLIGPLSGANVQIGTNAKRGVELALRETDTEGLTVELVVRDTDCSQEKSAAALEELIIKHKVVAVIGDFCSSATLAAAPIAEKYAVPLVSPASSSQSISQAGDYVFRTIPSDDLQSTFLAQLIADKDRQRVAIVHSNEPYGIGLQQAVKANLNSKGIMVVASESVDPQAIELNAQMRRIKATAPDALLIMSNSNVSNVAALVGARDNGITVPLFGSEALKSQTILIDAASAAEGLMVSAVSAGDAKFIEKFKAVYQLEPGDYSAQAYDAAKAIGNSIADGATTGQTIKAALYNINFTGATGQIKFDSNGDVNGNYLGFQVVDGDFVSLD